MRGFFSLGRGWLRTLGNDVNERKAMPAHLLQVTKINENSVSITIRSSSGQTVREMTKW